MAEVPQERPLRAYSTFEVTSRQVRQEIWFSYDDPGENYHTREEVGLLPELLAEIQDNMQYFIDQDLLYINGGQVNLDVKKCDLHYHRGRNTRPVLHFSVRSVTRYTLSATTPNVLELVAEEEVLDYPVEARWRFPSKVLGVETAMRSKVSGCLVMLKAFQGELVGGEEWFEFDKL